MTRRHLLALLLLTTAASAQPQPAGGALMQSTLDYLQTLNSTKAPIANPTFTGLLALGGTVLDGATYTCPGKYATLALCLDAAKAVAGSTNNGSDHAVQILLQEGTFTLSATYALASGMQLRGIMPRVTYTTTSPDDVMVKNGGTWIDCGGNQCFSGSQLRGVVLERLGLVNFGAKAFSVGGSNVDGIAQSRIADVWIQGSTTLNVSDVGMEIYNPAHLNIDRLKVNNINTGLRIVSQMAAWEPGNCVITDLYINQYPKSVANGNNTKPGLLLESLDHGAGVNPLAYMTFIRPQISEPSGGDSTSVHVRLNGGIYNSIWDADLEGNAASAVDLQNSALFHHIRIAGVSGTITNHFTADASSSGNVVEATISPFRYSDSNNNTLFANFTRYGPYTFNGLVNMNGLTNAAGDITINGGTLYLANTGVSSTIATFGGSPTIARCLVQNGGNPTTQANIKCYTKTGTEVMDIFPNDTAPLRLIPTTVSALASCSSTWTGRLAVVSDATAPTYNATVTGGGAVMIPVMCNGTNWVAH